MALIEKVHGPRHPSVVGVLDDLGATCAWIDPDAALAYFQQALDLGLALHGEAHPEVSRAAGNVGAALLNHGQAEASLPYFEQALRATEATEPPEGPAIALPLFNLGIVQRRLGDLDAARDSFVRVERIWSGRRDAGLPLHELGGMALEAGDADEAEAYLARALPRLEARWPGDPRVQDVLAGRAEAALLRDDPAAAVAFARRALVAEQALDRSPSDLASAHFLLARAFASASSRRAAGDEIARAIAIARSVDDVDLARTFEHWRDDAGLNPAPGGPG